MTTATFALTSCRGFYAQPPGPQHSTARQFGFCDGISCRLGLLLTYGQDRTPNTLDQEAFQAPYLRFLFDP